MRQRLVFGPCVAGVPIVESGWLAAFAEHVRSARMPRPRRAGPRCRPAQRKSSAICAQRAASAVHHVLHVGHVGFAGRLAHADEAHRHDEWARYPAFQHERPQEIQCLPILNAFLRPVSASELWRPGWPKRLLAAARTAAGSPRLAEAVPTHRAAPPEAKVRARSGWTDGGGRRQVAFKFNQTTKGLT